MLTESGIPNPFRYLLTRAGEHMPRAPIRALTAVAKYLELGHSLRNFGLRLEPRFETREQLFDIVGREAGDRDVLYLEFGVAEGMATRYWSKLLTNPKSRLHGFDSFEGLPENWIDEAPKGHFSTDGMIPDIDDPRVEFFKGWFDAVLPRYRFEEHEVLVLNLDADLYSSTKYALDFCMPHIVPGTYLYFDEFHYLDHEFRAFRELAAESGRTFTVRGATKNLSEVLLQCIR